MEDIIEEWRPVPDFEGLYEVSNTGLIRRVSTGRILKSCSNRGYKQVNLSKIYPDGKQRTIAVKIHRIVAAVFIQNIENKPYIDHIDGDKSNNIVTNLRWVTPKENSNNPITLERQRDALKSVIITVSIEKRKEISDRMKAWYQDNKDSDKVKEAMSRAHKSRRRKVMCIETGEIFESGKAAAIATGVSAAAITLSCDNYEKGARIVKYIEGRKILHFKRLLSLNQPINPAF